MSWLKDKYGIMVTGLFVSLILDQLTKSMIIFHFPKEARLSVIPRFFEIYHAQNTGSAFSLFRGYPILFFVAVNALAIGFILYYFVKLERDRLLLAASLSLILGGALGNLVDRIRHGSVVDFLRFYVGDYSWPTFNVADISILTGVTFFAIHMIQTDVRMRRRQIQGN